MGECVLHEHRLVGRLMLFELFTILEVKFMKKQCSFLGQKWVATVDTNSGVDLSVYVQAKLPCWSNVLVAF